MLACHSEQIFKPWLSSSINEGDNNSLFMAIFRTKWQRVQQGIRTVVATGILGRIQGDFCDTTSESWDTDLNTYRFTDSNLTGFTSLAQQIKTYDVWNIWQNLHRLLNWTNLNAEKRIFCIKIKSIHASSIYICCILSVLQIVNECWNNWLIRKPVRDRKRIENLKNLRWNSTEIMHTTNWPQFTVQQKLQVATNLLSLFFISFVSQYRENKENIVFICF